MTDPEEEMEPDAESESFEEEDSEGFEETEEEKSEASEEEERTLEENEAHALPEEATPKALSLGEIPMNVVIEVGRVQMPIKSVMNLKPGNLLDLHLHPESGVDLVVNGSRIGKGELLQIGGVLGVRILELG